MTIPELIARMAGNINMLQTLNTVATIPGVTPAMRNVIALYGLTIASQVHRDAEALETLVAAL